MSNNSNEGVCVFEGQRFRPTFCKHCFKTKAEHVNSPITTPSPSFTPSPLAKEQLGQVNLPPNPSPTPLNSNADPSSTSLQTTSKKKLVRTNSQSKKELTQISVQSAVDILTPHSTSKTPREKRSSHYKKENSMGAIPLSKGGGEATSNTISSSTPSSSSSSSSSRSRRGTSGHAKNRIAKEKVKKKVKEGYIKKQVSKGEVVNVQKFLHHFLLRNLLVEGVKLSSNETEEILKRTQSCVKPAATTAEGEVIPLYLLDRKGRDFLINHMKHIQDFLNEQDELKSIIKVQSVARRYLLLKKFRGLDKRDVSLMKLRNDNYLDLIRTEKQYLRTIDQMIEMYVIPLRQSDLIAPYECAAIFSNLESISEVHKEFLEKIQKLDGRFPFITGIGRVFLDLSSILKAYSVFVGNFKNAINEIERLQSDNPKFQSFLSDKADDWIDLTTLLSMPLNRISQYEHIMKNMLESVKEGTEDYEDGVKAISVLSQSSQVIELNLAQSGETARIQACQRKLRADGPVALIKPGRKLLCELKAKKNSVFLFSDIVIVAKPQSKSKSHRDSHRGGVKTKEEILKVSIHNNIQDVDLLDIDPKRISSKEINKTKSKETIEIKTKKEGIVEKISFSTPDEKTKWQRLFTSIIEEANRVKVFGVGLGDTVVREEKSNGIPTIIEKTISHISQYYLEQPGLFRVAGSKVEIDKLKSIFDQGGDELKSLDLNAYQAYSVSDVMKLYFRLLPEPLLGYALYKPIVHLMREDEGEMDDKVASMKKLVLMWTPPFAVKVLKYLISFLSNVASLEEVNKMSSSNLSIVFGPTLLWPEQNTLESAMDMPYINSFVQTLIDYHRTIFE